ncbi:MAG: hypothetical protein J7639_24315 [Paenibacillaceae bacterium]|nr:hypothetical protein [Paenibacillaceae bacterium]
MIIENTGIKGMKSDLAHLDESTEKLGFVRWQWEYYRATYDYKYEDRATKSEYYLRVNARVESGRLEKPDAILYLEDAYIGKTTFPHGLDYNAPIPDAVLSTLKSKLDQLKHALAH